MSADNRRRDKFKATKKHFAGKPNRKNPRKNVQIYEDTIAHCQEHFPDVEYGQLIDFATDEIDISDKITISDQTTIKIASVDTLDMCQEVCKSLPDSSIMVLNMASDFKPGGSVSSGGTAQEECIFRRTNAFATHDVDLYPLNHTQFIYSNVVLFRDAEYNIIKPIEIGLCTMSALRKPALRDGNYRYEPDKVLMRRKIKHIFLTAIEFGHDVIILGALGCGVFKNPAQEVAEIFKHYINKYTAYFRYIGFAILVNKPADQANLDIFQSIIGMTE